MSPQAPPMWIPILEGELERRAREAIGDVREALKPTGAPADRATPLLLAEHALFHAYAELALGKSPGSWAQDLLDAAIEGVANSPLPPWLYGGFLGVAWTMEVMQRLVGQQAEPGGPAQEDFNEETDQVLLNYLNREIWAGSYDLIVGLVGMGVYALERGSRPAAIQCLESIVDHLSRQATRTNGDVAWWTPPHLIPSIRSEDRVHGQYNLGVAHGAPGVIAFLAEVFDRGIAMEKTGPLLAGGVAWLLKQRLPEGSGSSFPAVITDGSERRPSRAAWCYGDPGISVALLRAARSNPELNLERTAIEIASLAASRRPETCGVVDPALCHGSAGLAHVYNRLFQATGKSEFLNASRFWFGRSLEMRKPGAGVGGFLSWKADKDPAGSFRPDSSFLEGAAGIGLALIAAITSVEPLWDRRLLTSVPPRFE